MHTAKITIEVCHLYPLEHIHIQFLNFPYFQCFALITDGWGVRRLALVSEWSVCVFHAPVFALGSVWPAGNEWQTLHTPFNRSLAWHLNPTEFLMEENLETEIHLKAGLYQKMFVEGVCVCVFTFLYRLTEYQCSLFQHQCFWKYYSHWFSPQGFIIAIKKKKIKKKKKYIYIYIYIYYLYLYKILTLHIFRLFKIIIN